MLAGFILTALFVLILVKIRLLGKVRCLRTVKVNKNLTFLCIKLSVFAYLMMTTTTATKTKHAVPLLKQLKIYFS